MTDTPKTGNEFVDAFLKDLEYRLSDADQRTPPASKEELRRQRSAIHLLATNDPAYCERFIRRWMSHHGYSTPNENQAL